MKAVLLIDGDQFVYRACAAVEKETLWDDQNHILYSNENEAWDNLAGMLERIFERFDSREHALTFSAPPNFRTAIDPTYKSARPKRKPLCYAALRERVEGEYNCIAMAGLEADDVMGILATKPGAHQRIIVSIDKDMRTIPSTIWNGEDLITVTEDEANRFHLYQTIIGDTSDGYKGCPGSGDVAASEFLAEPFAYTPIDHVLKSGPRKGVSEVRWVKEPLGDRPMWDGLVSFFRKAGLTADDALKQARLARILRWSDWDHDKRAPILWTP